MKVKIEDSWLRELEDEFEKDYFKSLVEFVREEYMAGVVYPPGKKIFSAFDACPFDDVKTVIIGQDPYHGPGQANGLCFSVQSDIPHPPSLINIFKEIESDMGYAYPKSGDLSRWAKQGVLLLNATLTVKAGQAGSHQNKGWEKFTDAVINKLNGQEKRIVFMLWGGYAKKKGKQIDRSKHKVLETGHPSPLSANRGYWFGNKHFSQANAAIEKMGKELIDWH